MAAYLRDNNFTKNKGRRKLLTPDAIHLASCLHLEDAYGVTIDEFHTYDSGKGKGLEGKAAPILGFEEWCDECKDNLLIERTIKLKRTKPLHPSPPLLPRSPKPSKPSGKP